MVLVSHKIKQFNDRQDRGRRSVGLKPICGVRVRSKLSLPPITVTGRDRKDVVTSLSLWFAARPKAEVDDAPRNRTAESRAALRFVCLELLQARTVARIYLERRQRSSDSQLSIDAWQAHRGAIALELSISDWTSVVSAYDAVSSISSGACDAHSASGAPSVLSASVSSPRINVELLTPRLEAIERGCMALAPYALDIMRDPV